MANLATIESEIHTALKERNTIAADTLRGLKTRIQNEQIAKGHELSEEEIVALVASEVKRRKEAAEAFTTGGRSELAQKEIDEATLLQKFLPAQVSEADLRATIQAMAADQGWTGKQDFGKAMGALKQKYGASADGSMLAQLLKEQLGS